MENLNSLMAIANIASVDRIDPFTGKRVGASQPTPPLGDWRPFAEARRIAANPAPFFGNWNPFGAPPTAALKNPFDPRVISQTKDPEMEAIISSMLGKITGGNVNELRRDVRSPALQQLIGGAMSNYTQDSSSGRAALERFLQDYTQAGTGIGSMVNQENQALGRVFGGAEDPNSLASVLELLRKQDNIAGAGVQQQAMNALIRSGKSAALVGGGSGGSFAQGQLLDTAMQIAAQEKLRQSNLRRQNVTDVVGLQGQFSGRRQSASEAFASRGALPLQLAQALRSGDLANLGQIGNLDLSNLLTERAGDQLARELGLIGGVRELRASNRFEGLEKEVEQDFTGLNPTRQPGVGPAYNIPDLLRILQAAGAAQGGGTTNPRGAGTNPLLQNLLSQLGVGPQAPRLNESIGGVQLTPEIAAAYQKLTGQSPFSPTGDENPGGVSPELLKYIQNQFYTSAVNRMPQIDTSGGRRYNASNEPSGMSDDEWASLFYG